MFVTDNSSIVFAHSLRYAKLMQQEVRMFPLKLCTFGQTNACIIPSRDAGSKLRCLRTKMNYYVCGKGAMIVLFPLKKLFFIG